MTLSLQGLGISRGIAIGRAHILARDQFQVIEYRIADSEIEAEVRRFESGLAEAKRQLAAIRSQIPPDTPLDVQSLIDTQILMLDDAAFAQVPSDIIRIRRCNAEWALKLQRDALVKVFQSMADPYLRTRQDDIDYVVNAVQRVLLCESSHAGAPPDHSLNGAVVLADDLSPADTMLLQHQGIAAFVTEYGGVNSHTAILARSLGIPALVGVHNVRHHVQPGETIVVDGWHGVLLAGADLKAIAFYHERQREEDRHTEALHSLVGRPALTRDGQVIQLYANLELQEDFVSLQRVAADGIGLYRTEMLFLNREDPPSEDEQLDAYCHALSAVNGGGVTIRTLDIGADKTPAWAEPLDSAIANPALSLRGVRWCLHEADMFRTQLRAILRASAYGSVRIMLPMLSSVAEVRQVRRLLDEVKRDLTAQRLAFSDSVPLGGMIEVPAAAAIADVFARNLDFLSIGTNDLIQYSIAADRVDDSVSYLYDPLHPGVLRLIHSTIVAGARAGIPVAMCGEMAGDTRYTRLLLGMGLRQFSMHPAFLLEVKRIINGSETAALAAEVNRLLMQADYDGVVEWLERVNCG